MRVFRVRPTARLTYSCLVLVILFIFSVLLVHHLAVFPSDQQREKDSNKARRSLQQQADRLDLVDGQVNLPVYVFEEHHEAVQYWFAAVQSGILHQRSGNTLIHIDAHSDLALPIVEKDFPLFKWPQFQEISRLMNENDRFIAAAAVTGIFSRIVWIWPSWDRTSILEELHGEATIWNVTLGFWLRPQPPVVRRPKSTMLKFLANRVTGFGGKSTSSTAHVKTKDLCLCVTALNPPTRWNETMKNTHCFRSNSSNPDEVPKRTSEVCHPGTSIIVETYSEDELLKSPTPEWTFNPVSKYQGFILDIDEDFFGCEAAVQPLYDVGLNETFIRRISHWVEKLFCGSNAEHERASDYMFFKITQYILKHKNICSNLAETSDPYKILVNPCLANMYYDLSMARQTRSTDTGAGYTNDIFCGLRDDAFDKSLLYQLLSLLSSLKENQLKALGETGICYQVSLNTYDEARVGHFRLCDGYNRPNQTAVTFFSPSDEEVEARMIRFQRILGHLHAKPNLVTLCRSVRDGYTPRSRSQEIEERLLKILRKQDKSSSRSSRGSSTGTNLQVFYDRELLGGKDGWWKRHKNRTLL